MIKLSLYLYYVQVKMQSIFFQTIATYITYRGILIYENLF